MHLDELQNTFQQYLLDNALDSSILTSLSPVSSGEISDRLNIYHHAYRARIREGLSNQFPNLKKLLGNELFNSYVDKFIAQHPSNFRNMRWLGDTLSEYLYEIAPDKPMVGDMANFEWHLGLAFDSADTQIISVQNLSTIDPAIWGALTFKWHSSVYLGNAQTNVIDAWNAMEADSNADLTHLSKPLTYLIWRKNLVSQFKSVNETEASAIAFMLQNHTFGELCELLATQLAEDKALETAAGLLADWLQQEMLVGLNIDNES